jgi:outer membrane biosynthesis protein TonB
VHRSIAAAGCAASAAIVFGVAMALPVYAGPVRASVGSDPLSRRALAGQVANETPTPGADPTVDPTTTTPPTTPPPTTSAPAPTPTQPKPTKSKSPSPTPTRKPTTAPTQAPVKKTPAYRVPTFTQPPESRPTLEPGVLEEEDDPAEETAAPVAVRSTPSTKARRDIAFIIIGVGGAALLGLGGIAGLYFTSGRHVAPAAADPEDGYGAEGDGTERD